MDLDRRTFLSAMGAAVAVATRPMPARGAADKPAVFFGCGADGEGRFVAAGLDMNGGIRFGLPLPARGHGLALRAQDSELVVFARRPGNFAAVVETSSGRPRHRIAAMPGRHFYGHGVFSADGATLFATENDYDSGRGAIGLYDARDGYRRIGEFSSHGIGPHDLRLMPDGATLAVANGGIRTHPDSGRAKLNLDSMAPNLAFVDSRDGSLMKRVRLSGQHCKLSIRHLDVDRRGCVAFAMQYEGDRRDRVPLVGLYNGQGQVRLLPVPESNRQRMRQYTGSIAFDAAGGVLAASSPRGHVVTFWDSRTAALIRQVEAADASGIARTGAPGQFLIAGGDGALWLVQARSGKGSTLLAPNPHIRWDNHLFDFPISQTSVR